MTQPDPVVYVQKISRFNQDLLLPCFTEIADTLRKHDQMQVWVFEGLRSPDVVSDVMLRIGWHDLTRDPHWFFHLASHPPHPELICRRLITYIGHTMAVIRPESRIKSRYGGRFLESIQFRLGPEGDVYAAPVVMYYMLFNRRINVFQHRFDPNVKHQPIEEITREQILNHHLNAFDFFKLFAWSETRPGWMEE